MARDLAEGVVEIALRAVADNGDALIALERATTALADLRDEALAELDQSERP
jgi:hypothetical protein